MCRRGRALALVIRAFEFAHLNTRWDQDAYGSVAWTLMLLHTTHLITDFVDTVFLAVFLFTHRVDERALRRRRRSTPSTGPSW